METSSFELTPVLSASAFLLFWLIQKINSLEGFQSQRGWGRHGQAPTAPLPNPLYCTGTHWSCRSAASCEFRDGRKILTQSIFESRRCLWPELCVQREPLGDLRVPCSASPASACVWLFSVSPHSLSHAELSLCSQSHRRVFVSFLENMFFCALCLAGFHGLHAAWVCLLIADFFCCCSL